MPGNWTFSLAYPYHVELWSRGKVAELSDLYKPRVFGSNRNLQCNCGAYSGTDFVGMPCGECNSYVSEDVSKDRRTWMGHIELGCTLDHPFIRDDDHRTGYDTACFLEALPVAPIAYRQREDGTLTALGHRYERLVAANITAIASLPPRGTRGSIAAQLAYDKSELIDAVASIFGVSKGRKLNDQESLYAHFTEAIIRGDANVDVLSRCCVLSIKANIEL